MAADSARLRIPYGTGGMRRATRVRFEQPIKTNHSGLILLGLGMLAVGASIGYLVSRNQQLESSLAAKDAEDSPIVSDKKKGESGRKDAGAKKPEGVKVKKVPSVAPAEKEEVKQDAAGKKEAPKNVAPVAVEPAGPRGLFLGTGLSYAKDYVAGPRGHAALAHEIWMVHVKKVKMREDWRWDLVLELDRVLKGRQHEPGRTLTIVCNDVRKEFKLEPGNQGKKLVTYLKKDGSFFILAEEDYQLVKE